MRLFSCTPYPATPQLTAATEKISAVWFVTELRQPQRLQVIFTPQLRRQIFTPQLRRRLTSGVASRGQEPNRLLRRWQFVLCH